jgi:hypothetical protein
LSGGIFNILGNGSFTNQGAINVSNGDVLSITTNSWSNTGTISVTGGTLNLGGSFTLSQLGTLTHTGGTVNVIGTLDDTGATLNVGTGTGPGTLTLANGGTIKNGTIVSSGSGIVGSGGTLDGVTYQGALDLSATTAAVFVKDGFTGGAGGATVNLTGLESSLRFEGAQAASNTTINIGNSGNFATIYNWDTAGAATVTLGTSLTINQVGADAELDTSENGNTTSSLINAGTINAGLSGGIFNILGNGSFTNQGAINVSNGDVLSITTNSWSNTGTISANGGNINIAVAETGGGSDLIYGTSQIEYSLASAGGVTFEAGATGQLLLLKSALFTGTVTGFSGSSTGTPATSDKLDLRDINFASAQFTKSFANNVLTVTDGTNTANIKMVGAYALANFEFASDGNGGTLITEIAAQSVTISPVEGNNLINAAEAAAGVPLSGTVSGIAGGSTFNVTVTDNGIIKTYVATVNATGTNWSATIPSSDATVLANGTATISALVIAANGNQATATQTVTVAEAGPTVSIAISPTNLTVSAATATVTFTFSEATAAFSLSNTTATGGTLSSLQQISPTVWTAVFTANSDIQTTAATVGVKAGSYQDSAGNLGAAGNSADFSIDTIPNSWANSSGGSWTDGTNWSSGSVPGSSANVQIAPYGSSPYTILINPGTGVVVNSLTLSDPNATLLDEGTLSIEASLATIAGFLEVSGGGTLSVNDGASLTVDFVGTGGGLVLGSSFTGTVNAISTAHGAVAVTGNGNVATATGDAIDLSASGGTTSNPANLGISLAGAITGAANGISVVQNAAGNISIATSGPVIGQAGAGIFAEENIAGVGSIIIDGSGNVTGTGGTNNGIFAEILNPADSGVILVDQTGNISGSYDGIRAITYGNGTVTVTTGANAFISGSEFYAILALSYGTGNLSVTTKTGDVLTSNSAGMVAQSDATSVPQVGGTTTSSISVTAVGTINSGSALTATYFPPAGIIAGYNGTASTASFNASVFGNVTVNNSATINAAGGDGIRTFNYGQGNITVSDLANTAITAPGRYGILAANYGPGNISISTNAGDTISSGSSGIDASDNATAAPAGSTISVTALGTIDSGFMPSGNGLPGGIQAGYNGGSGTVNSNVLGNVVVDSSANINTAFGYGIELYNDGLGNLTATLESSSAITAPKVGVNAYTPGGGNVSVTNHGTITVATGVGISAGTGNGVANSVGGLITINNTDAVTALGSTTSPVIQINNGSTQVAVFTNSGTITSQLFSTSGLNQAIAAYNGSLTLNNSGTITGDVGLATATFNNNTGGIWNAAGSNYFGNNANAINNAGTINISGSSTFTASGTLAFNNSNAVNLLPDSYAYVGGAVSGINGTGGTFLIEDFSTLEFANAVGAAGQTVSAGQTISFADGNALLTLDSPSTFAGYIANLAIGDTIDLVGISVKTATISGSTLTVTENGSSQVLAYNLINAPPSTEAFNISGDAIQLSPAQAVANPIVTGASGPVSETTSTQQTYVLSSSAMVSGSGTDSFTSTDSTAGDFITVEINQGASISVSGTNNVGVNLTTSAANIALISAGTITSAGGKGINTNSGGTGTTVIVDNGNVTGSTTGIAATTASGSLDVVLGQGVTVTGTATFGISAISMSGVIKISTSPVDTITSGSIGINAQVQGASVPQSDNSAITIFTYGTINSGGTQVSPTSEPAGIKVGYTGGSSAPTTAVDGSINISNNANITAAGGSGIFAYDYGVGNISISDGSSGSGTAITATAAGTTPVNFAQYGIGAFAYEAGNVTVTTGYQSTIQSGSSGINAGNQATAIPVNPDGSVDTVTVVALGTIASGANSTNSGFSPAGIEAGFNTNSAFDPNVNINVYVDFAGTSITAAAGQGIRAFNYGIGNVSVDVAGGAMITAKVSGTSSSSDNAPYGIGAFNYGPGNIAITTSNGDTITSGSSGIDAVNEATAITAVADALVTVGAAGSISSGTILTNSGGQPAGIAAGFLGGTSSTSNSNVNGTVIVNNIAAINAAAGLGINAFNYGNGDITVNDSGAVSGAQSGVSANAQGGGAGDIAINIAAGASLTGTSNFGIIATSIDTGNISIVTSAGDSITSGSAGIDAVNEAATIGASSSITVTAYGTIDSGTTITGSGAAPAGIVAAYNPGLANNADSAVQGDISITDFASILAPTGTDGIRGANYGVGTVTIVAEAGATIAAGRYGIAALSYDGGDLSVTSYATVSGTTAAIDATTTSTGTATINNYGNLTGEVTSYNSSFTNEVGGEWSFAGTSAFTGASNLVNVGAIDSNGTAEISGLSSIANSGTIEVQSGSLKLDAGVSGTGTLTIDASTTLELTAAVSSGQIVVFSSTTGMLKLDQAQNFNGLVSGFSTTDGTLAHSDQIDLADINHESASFNELFNSTTDTLTVTDGINTAVIHFTGTVGTLNFVDDGNLVNGVSGTSGTIVYDPPAASQSLDPTAAHDHGDTPHKTTVAAEQNQTLSSSAAGDNFLFNFASSSHDTVKDLHPLSDALLLVKPILANAQPPLVNALEEGHSHTAFVADNHDSLTAVSVIKAQLHADFHIL